uniref:Uncharacterized protein n=1 Tax=Fundulus heteroclitus TaxID=8078 RepID=A0A3Q2NW83_FUNHE
MLCDRLETQSRNIRNQLDSRKVLGPSSLHQNHVVLLQVVSLPRDEHHRLLPVGETHPSALPVGRVGLLGFPDHRLQDDGFELRPAEGGAQSLRGDFGLPLPVHLVESGHALVSGSRKTTFLK